MSEQQLSWAGYFLGIAEAVSKRSHCLSHHFGAVAVRNNHVLSTGYNGPPSGYPHCEGTECPRRKVGYQSGQGLDICPAAHAELNVLVQAAKYGIGLDGATLYVTSPTPCRECAKAIVNAGIKQVITNNSMQYPDIGLSGKKILKACGIEIKTYIGDIIVEH